jgi:hypothetical protein
MEHEMYLIFMEILRTPSLNMKTSPNRGTINIHQLISVRDEMSFPKNIYYNS